MMRKPRVYLASKMKHAPLMRMFRTNFAAHVEVVSRWIDHDESLETNGTPSTFSVHWSIDEIDVKRSDFVLVYGEKEDELRGALVEVGMGIAYGKRIILIGNCASYGTWQHHPAVIWANDAVDAIHIMT